MKNLLAITSLILISTSVLAGNNLPDSEIKAMQDQTNDKILVENILSNEKMKRLHKEMTRYGMSEVGMEARRQMIGTEEGHAYHRALQNKEKNTAG